jgi:type II secretory pathway pseudopilin PulG
MKPTTPHDPLDDQIAAALHGDLTSEERTQFESRLSNDPNAQAAYQEAKAMHDLLEQTHRTAQPDPDFEQRMVSAVRRKLAHPPHQETAWESLIVLWRTFSQIGKFRPKLRLTEALVVLFIIAVLAGVAFGPITSATKKAKGTAEMQRRHAEELAADEQAQQKVNLPNGAPATLNGFDVVDQNAAPAFRNRPFGRVTLGDTRAFALNGGNSYSGGTIVVASGGDAVTANAANMSFASGGAVQTKEAEDKDIPSAAQPMAPTVPTMTDAPPPPAATASDSSATAADMLESANAALPKRELAFLDANKTKAAEQAHLTPDGIAQLQKNPAAPAPTDSRKLIRNSQLDLEVKSYQSAIDQVSALTKSAGGYVDTSNSQRGGNGKLQGTVVVKILPENLDTFLLKLRDLGEVQNQSVSTDDVTKEYFDTQARLVNSQKMEEQLQELLKRENGKVSDLLAVERELGRVRGEIEQMQGQLKLYDFQVQYATVTMNIAEKDLNQTAAYLLKEQDNFSLFATDVEDAFKKARATADQFNAQVLAANLEHVVNSDNNQVGASLVVMVAPDQIEPFLTQIRSLGRVANFTRQTQRVAKDGGDSNQPADETKTEKDKVRVELSIRSDDDSRKQVALTVVAKDVSDALDQAKVAALANVGTEILNSSLNTTPEGASTAQLSVRVPGKEYSTLMDAFRALGRSSSLSIQRNDNAGPGASGDDVPVIVTLALTDNDAPVQQTNLVIAADDVDTQAQQIKKQAGDAGVEIKSSSFERQPDGTEQAQMTLRLPLGHYATFLATLQKAGKTESLSVQRDDRPDQTRADDTAPAEIQLQLHNQAEIVPDNSGLWTTLRDTFGQGFAALFGSVRVIGVIVAFLIPWAITLVVLAWIGRRIYVWRKNR